MRFFSGLQTMSQNRRRRGLRVSPDADPHHGS